MPPFKETLVNTAFEVFYKSNKKLNKLQVYYFDLQNFQNNKFNLLRRINLMIFNAKEEEENKQKHPGDKRGKFFLI